MSQPAYITEESAISLIDVEEKAKNVVYPEIYTTHLKSLLISHDEIMKRTQQIALQIHSSFPCNEPLVLLCVLKGSSPFCHLLMQQLSLLRHPFLIEYIRAKSYEGTASSGNVQVLNMKVPSSVNGRNVIVVEDIVDTGKTLSVLIPIIESANPASVLICTLLVKRISGSPVAFEKFPSLVAGFSIPDAFVIGFGLDYNELYRDLLDIWVISQKGIEYGANAECENS